VQSTDSNAEEAEVLIKPDSNLNGLNRFKKVLWRRYRKCWQGQ